MRRGNAAASGRGSWGSLRDTAGLGVGQLFAVIFGFLVTSVLIFLFGFLVGREWEDRQLVQEERVVKASVGAPPTANPAAPGTGVDAGFYEHQTQQAMQRLQATPLASPTVTPVPTRTPRRFAERPTPRATPRGRHEEEAAQERARPGATWTVQVNATTNIAEAVGLTHRLRTKGYDAYTVQAPMRGQTWYRVRVGRFGSRDAARDMAVRLRRDEGMDNAYPTPQ